MTTILCIETAEKICSVALSQNGKCIDERIESNENSHAKSLTLLIDDLLKSNGIDYDSLDAIAVSSGPGSYTGLRIGVSTAKGLCWAKEKPLISVPTLESIKERASATHKGFEVIIPNIDARRNEVFMTIFENDKQVSETQPYVLDENPLLQYQNKNCLIIGSGADKFKPYITEGDIIDQQLIPSAKYSCGIAFEYFQNNNFEDVAYFEPLYFKPVHVMKSKKKIF